MGENCHIVGMDIALGGWKGRIFHIVGFQGWYRVCLVLSVFNSGSDKEGRLERMTTNYVLWVSDLAQGEFKVEGDFAALRSLRIILERHYHPLNITIYRPDGTEIPRV